MLRTCVAQEINTGPQEAPNYQLRAVWFLEWAPMVWRVPLYRHSLENMQILNNINVTNKLGRLIDNIICLNTYNYTL